MPVRRLTPGGIGRLVHYRAGLMDQTVVWRKSSRSLAQSNCVEVAVDGGLVWVRDSKNPRQPALSFQPARWRAFIEDVKDGRLARDDEPAAAAD